MTHVAMQTSRKSRSRRSDGEDAGERARDNIIAVLYRLTNQNLSEIGAELASRAPEDSRKQFSYNQRLIDWKSGNRDVPDWIQKIGKAWIVDMWVEEESYNPGKSEVTDVYATALGIPELIGVEEALQLAQRMRDGKRREAILKSLAAARDAIARRILRESGVSPPI